MNENSTLVSLTCYKTVYVSDHGAIVCCANG